ncbi:hypothetical protein CPS_3724 [Colwellia psychrerythraea 34H]|uniref:Uncharacterized protein n=1 Tax=Colwellia psychrerythraea (strain 34H / ATCC BAA-681) TaxID=167879 RepID=Q47XS9_COLP3|nr:hypothetical protein CPS_3724 [Colwellia psychrerythraea 34H]
MIVIISGYFIVECNYLIPNNKCIVYLHLFKV